MLTDSCKSESTTFWDQETQIYLCNIKNERKRIDKILPLWFNKYHIEISRMVTKGLNLFWKTSEERPEIFSKGRGVNFGHSRNWIYTDMYKRYESNTYLSAFQSRKLMKCYIKINFQVYSSIITIIIMQLVILWWRKKEFMSQFGGSDPLLKKILYPLHPF